MIRFQADADLRNSFVRAVRLREPAIDFAASNDSGLRGLPDPEVLKIAAEQGRILISHDRRTMADHFRAHLAQGKFSPGVLLITQSARMGQIVDSIIMVWAASEAFEWENQLRYLPSMSRHFFTR